MATSSSKQVVPDDVSEIKEVREDVTQTEYEKPSKTTKEREFLEDWKKNYSWLEFDKDSNSLYCKICTDKKLN